MGPLSVRRGTHSAQMSSPVHEKAEPTRSSLAYAVDCVLSLASYAYFFWSLPLAATAFMINLSSLMPAVAPYFPYSIDNNPVIFQEFSYRLALNAGLLSLFAVPHSFFARPAVKNALPMGKLYRSLYVAKSAACLHLLIKFWQPLDARTLWDFKQTGSSGGSIGVCSLHSASLAVYAFGWVWLVTSTFALDHLELFGLKDGFGVDIMRYLGVGLEDGKLVERAHYRLCRHPIVTGFFVMFFSVPTMTLTHLFFSGACTAYILLAVSLLEEPDLVASFGDEYRDYRHRVPMYCPFTGRGGSMKKET